ncbi:MAG: hypothetical protein HY676_02060 [Chloroflexi bacterium]|nr:hypothetical protein [Chloroflexota bacterium]
MAKQITLDTLRLRGVNLFKDEAGSLKVEANYQLLAGSSPLSETSRDVTTLLSSALVASLSSCYDDIASSIAQEELA